MLKNIHRICAPDAVLEVLIGVDEQRDATELQRLGIDSLSADLIDAKLAQRYEASGFRIIETGTFSADNWPNICTSWAQRLKTNDNRNLVYIIAARYDNK